MRWEYDQRELKKRHALRISRGVSASSTNLFVTVQTKNYFGIGEAAPGTGAATADLCQQQLTEFINTQDGITLNPFDSWFAAREAAIAPCAWAAVDIALWDLHGKIVGQPLHQLLGLPNRAVATSVTIGILPPDEVRERVAEILDLTDAKFLKIKLGSPSGIDADQMMYMQVWESVQGSNVGLRVDANGGWTLSDARRMISWLSEHNCDYVEQPLNTNDDDQLEELFRNRALPIFVDESVNFSTDIPRLARFIDGVNLKLMKCGGITEALRIVATARAHKLGTMIGCMGESSVSIAAGAAIGALFDHIDLDSHLNLDPDPASGLDLKDGVVCMESVPGHGASLLC
ncbi:MAG: dipeptide epimerase [Acidiferrobacteraceae bacterium]|nr:dipeptide epimerase [Acidiferrobacteraceae bacterium]